MCLSAKSKEFLDSKKLILLLNKNTDTKTISQTCQILHVIYDFLKIYSDYFILFYFITYWLQHKYKYSFFFFFFFLLCAKLKKLQRHGI